MYTIYRISFGADTTNYPIQYEQQRHRTGTSRSHTSNMWSTLISIRQTDIFLSVALTRHFNVLT